MKTLKFCSTALLAGAVCGMLFACRNGDSSTYTTGLERYDLTQEERLMLELKAKSGNQKAATRLMLYYGFVRHDTKLLERWRKVAES